MNTAYPHVPQNKLAYIRQIDRADLPADVAAQVPDGADVWGVHDAQGTCLALTGDRRAAFFMARENNLAPVSVH